MSKRYSLNQLRRSTHYRPDGTIVSWLKYVGVIPNDVAYVPPTRVLTRLNPEAIEAGYLASVAYEWDAMGPSLTTEFISMLEMETEGARKDFVASLLTALGREVSYV